MSDRTLRTPSYRRHTPTGQAVVTLDGRDFYLGKFGSPGSRAEYDRVIAEWLANGRRLPPASGGAGDATVTELMVDYIRHADSYYVKDGRPTSEATLVREALKVLRRLYGSTPARDFGPLKLKAVRQSYIDGGLCRNEVNRRTGLVIRFFKWAVENERVPPSIHHGLKAVAGLRKGRTDVRESKPVGPVPTAFVDAIGPHAPPRIWAMVELQRLTGMRPGEVCIMRTIDLDMSGSVWIYTPESHKTEHHGRERKVCLGPKAQQVLKPWLKTDLTAYLFSPKEAMEQRWVEQRRERKSPVQPSQRDRKTRHPQRPPGECYTPGSYRHAIATACAAAGVPKWRPNQLRHNAATMLRKEFGLETARLILGHASAVMTEVYAEADTAKALEVMGKIG